MMLRRRVACVGLSLLLFFFLVTYTLNMLLETDVVDDFSQSTHQEDIRLLQRHKGQIEHDKAERDDLDKVKDYINIYNITAPYKADFHCITMKTDPPTPVCLYNQWNDIYISHDLEFTGMWEPHVMSDLQEALRRDESLGLIDVGANIGVYSLLAAKMGRSVVSVEPNHGSLFRLHRAAVLAGTQHHITALNNAVSDYRGVATLRHNGNNQGDSHIQPGYEDCIGSCPTKVKVILLDDLRFVTLAERAVLKIDIQGEEERAMKRVTRLLDAVDVPYIYMEWMVMKSLVKASRDHQVAVWSLIETLTDRNYKPHRLNAEGATELNPKDWPSWPNDVVWRHLPSKTEYKKLIRNHFLHWP